MRKIVVPILAFSGVLGVGTYLALTLFAAADHRDKAIVMACVGLAAALAYGLAAFRGGLPRRS